MKKLLSFLLAFAMLLTLLPAAVAANVTESGTWEGFTWTLTDDGTLTVSGSGDIPGLDAGTPPWQALYEGITKVVV